MKFKKVCNGYYRSEDKTIEISKNECSWVVEKFSESGFVEWYEGFETKRECVEYANSATAG
jgi:hypothetical protein